jgi:hypothetical protein
MNNDELKKQGLKRFIPAALCLALVLIFVAPTCLNPQGVLPDDEHRATDLRHDLSFHLNLKTGLADQGQFPLRTHLFGGGYPILGHPSDGTLSPASWTFLLLPIHWAVRVNLVLLLWLGAFGVFLLAREKLGLKTPWALASAAAFAFSGWLPSFLATGFYVHSYYLVVPMALYLLSARSGTVRNSLLAGFLLLLPFFQAGNGFLACVHFLAVSLLLLAAQESRPLRGGILIAIFGFVLVSAIIGMPIVFAIPSALAFAALLFWLYKTLASVRQFLRTIAPYAIRLFIALIVVVAVGCGKWVPMVQLLSSGTYLHGDRFLSETAYPHQRSDVAQGHEFYASVPAFLRYAFNSAPEKRTPDAPGEYRPNQEDYAPLGITFGILALFPFAILLARRRFGPWALLFLLYLWICLGPYGPVDAYRFLIWRLPGFSKLFDPFKYFNFFLVLPVTLGFGLAVQKLGTLGKRPLLIGAALSLFLIWPLVQNASLLKTVFSEPIENVENEPFHQVHLLPDLADLPNGLPAIREKVYENLLHERGRPLAATGLANQMRGVGTIDWYADINLPQAAVPKTYLMPDGAAIENPEYRGEAWCERGGCSITDSDVTMNKISVTASVQAADIVVVNQNYDPRFRVEGMEVLDHKGLLAVRVESPGEKRIVFKYRPWGVIAALLISLLSLIATIFAAVRFGNKRLGAMADSPEEASAVAIDKERSEFTRIAILLLVAILLFSAPMFFSPEGFSSDDEYRNADWLNIMALRASLYKSVHELGGLPLWSPYFGGGYPTIEHPSDGSLTPFALPVLLLGEVYGEKLNLLLLLFVGVFGVFLTARRHLKLSQNGALFSAGAYLVAGWFPSMMLVGFYNVAMFHLVPLIVYFMIRGIDEPRWMIPAGGLYATLIMVGASSVYTTGIFTAVLFVAMTAGAVVKGPKTAWKPAVALLLFFVIAAGLASAKIMGVSDLLERGKYEHGSIVADAKYSDVGLGEGFYEGSVDFARSLVAHVPVEAQYENGRPVTKEYAFLGIPWAALLLLPLALIGLRRRAVAWVIAGGVMLALCLGPNSPLDLYRVMIWPFERLRAIFQFYKYGNYFVMFVIALLSGGAITWIEGREFSNRGKRAIAAAAFLSLIPFGVVHGLLFSKLFANEAHWVQPERNFYQVKTDPAKRPENGATLHREVERPEALNEYNNVKRNVGTIDWYADIYLPEEAIPRYWVDPETGRQHANPNYSGEAWFVGLDRPEPGQQGGQLEAVTIGAGVVDATVNVHGRDVLVINQNFDPGWRSSKGEVFERRGLLALRLSERGKYDIRLRYLPGRFLGGLLLSLITLLACAVGWVRLSRKNR